MKYICELCGRIYDEALGEPRWGIGPHTPFENIPAHVTCPDCGSEKEAFYPAVAGNKMQPMTTGESGTLPPKIQKHSER